MTYSEAAYAVYDSGRLVGVYCDCCADDVADGLDVDNVQVCDLGEFSPFVCPHCQLLITHGSKYDWELEDGEDANF